MEGVHSAEAVIDNGEFGVHTIKFETGRLARQAAGSAVVTLDGETVVLSATTASKKPKDNLDFFPLTVDVEERMYAVGRIPGSFFRREGRPSEDAILTCRLIDRPLRPSFVKGLRNEIQIVETILALDPQHLYDVVAINAASMSTQLAGLPFSGPIGGVRVALIKGQWVGFPTHEQLAEATFDMVVAGRRLDDGDVAIMMVEAESTPETLKLIANPDSGAVAPTEETVAEGLEAAKPFIRVLCEAQQQLAAEAAKPTAEYPVFLDYGEDAYEAVVGEVSAELAQALTIAPKQEREAETDRLKALAQEKLAEQFEGRENEISAAFRSLTKKLVRERIISDGIRIDGRGLTDIRPLSAQTHVLPRVHGSALFERGETQIMGVTTLNMLRMEQMIDTLNPDRTKRYMHNYNFPPYSTGETGRVGSPKRREIGHGALAERALLPGAADPGGVPVRDPPGLRGARLERLHLDGLGLRLDHVAARRGRAAEGHGLRHRDGPDPGGRPVRDADRHPRRRGRVRRHGLQGRGHRAGHHRAAARHQARRHPRLGPGRGAEAGPRGPDDDPRRHARRHHRAGRDVRSTRRGSSRSRSRWTRSARSSARRAR